CQRPRRAVRPQFRPQLDRDGSRGPTPQLRSSTASAADSWTLTARRSDRRAARCCDRRLPKEGLTVAAESFFHVAVIVAHLETAIGDFSGALGLPFLDPITAPFPQLEDPTPRESFCRCPYSIDGPPHIELIEAN